MLRRNIPLLFFFHAINAQIALPTFHGVHKTHASCNSTSTFEVRIAAEYDDAEERENQSMYMNSSDLELIYDNSRQQVGMRFLNITIPQGTEVKNAYIRFTTDETNSSNVTVTFFGEDVDDAVTFATNSGNISSRTKTSASVDWTPDPWTSVGATHDSPDLTTIAQEIINRSGWSSGNDMVFIVTGTGTNKRTADSYRGGASNRPLLHIEYCTP
tara:strand:+ start:27 stop:668 length:642 start_codon:yes stop_codon:yes gene_type:complete